MLSAEEESKLAELNAHLDKAGRLAEELSREGRVVCMSLWSARQAGTLEECRLQANVARAYVRRCTSGPVAGSLVIYPPEYV